MMDERVIVQQCEVCAFVRACAYQSIIHWLLGTCQSKTAAIFTWPPPLLLLELVRARGEVPYLVFGYATPTGR